MTVSSRDEVDTSIKKTAHLNGIENSVRTLSESEAKIQKALVEEAGKEQLRVGEKRYVIEKRWFEQWKRYIDAVISGIDAESQYPGPVNNTSLFVSGQNNKLREHLYDDMDYQILSEKGWECLHDWYGLADGQEPIEKYVIEYGNLQTLKVEIYLTELKLCTFKNMDNVMTKSYSRVNTIGDVLKDMKQLFDIPEEEDVRVWNMFVKGTYELLPKVANSLQENSINSGQMLVLEKKENGEWPRQTRTRSLSSSSGMNIVSSPVESGEASGMTSPFASSFRPRATQHRMGLCGLNNLGNTCFMNAALQCLSNTAPLTKYFMSKAHIHELNPNNPLGMHGKIAEAYGELMQEMWNGRNSSVSPRHFKMQVGRFAPQFSGYQQQDTHELLAFLLDGLHEDLNRVKQKPYIELQDDKGRPDEVVATEAWKNHLLRNDSIIVDLFHGQFKSTVECPVCTKKSITFDPFCYLSLPLPIKKERNLYIWFIPQDASKKPIKLKVTVPKSGYTLDLTNAVARMTDSDPKKLVVFDVFGSRFHKKYQDKEPLSHISDRDDIYVYEIPIKSDKIQEEEKLVLPVYLRETNYRSYSSGTLFGTPLYVTFPKASTTSIEMYQIILKAMRRYVTQPTTLLQQSEKAHINDEEMPEEGQAIDAHSSEDDQSDDEMKIKDDEAEKEDDILDENEGKTKPKEPKFLFDISIVNSTANQEMKKLQYEDHLLQLKSSLYLAIDWSPSLKSKYYNSDLAKEHEEHESVSALPAPKKTIQLHDCLELFLQREKLGEEDPWFCPQCKEHRQAYKKFDLWTLPKILIIHLKRFSYSRSHRDKLDVLVDFPVNSLDLTDYVINKKHNRAVYDLHGVCNHYGGLGGGHYTAFGINNYDGQWHYFDDSSVSSADAKSPVSKAAYVLFYTRRDDPENEIMNTSELLSEDPSVFVSSDDESMD